MGIKLFSSGSSSNRQLSSNRWFSDGCIASTNVAPNPNPYKFKVISYAESDKFILLVLNYEGCTTYAGEKVLLYNIKDKYEVLQMLEDKNLDPHFLEDRLSPLMRFPASKEGFKMANIILGDIV